MRITISALVAVLTAIASPVLAATAGEPELAYTPSGFGNPDAMVCRAPQKLEDGSLGPRICMHNRIWMLLTQSAKDLAADGKATFNRPLVEEPHGNGPAEAVTCQKPVTITASRVWHGPVFCLQNKAWASLHERQLTLTSDGSLVSTKMSGPGVDPYGMPMIQGGPPPRNAPAIGGNYSPL